MGDTEKAAINVAAQPQCQYFVLRKKRLCRMTVRPGRQYCGEHEPQSENDAEETDLRVPCPNDPYHTCYVSKLEKHLLKCNARKVEEPPYIEHNINSPDHEDECPRIPLRDVPEETLMRVIDKVNTLYEKYIKDQISTFDPPAEHHPVVVEDISEAGRADTSRRHLRQASRLLQLAEAEGLVHEDTCYVELGAGKGMLSYYMCRAWCAGASRVVAVERAALRHKRDNRVRHAALRLRADLRHVALRQAPGLAAVRLVGLAKHLCGAATDYGIRCLAGGAARGALLAACCHHRCARASYVGAAPLQELGVSGPDLDVMFGIVSWATCGSGRPRDASPIPEGGRAPAALLGGRAPAALPAAERAAAGRRAKALLDHGRALYLAARGYRTKLCYYVPTVESLENLCLVAVRDDL